MDDMAEKIQALLGDEESLQQLKELAEMFGGGMGMSQNSPPPQNEGASNNSPPLDIGSFLGGINPMAIMSLMEAFSRSDPNCELIQALRPHLSKDKQLKADKAIKMLKIYNVYLSLKDSGILNDLNF